MFASSPTPAPALTPGLLLVLCLPSLFWAGNFIVGRAVSGLVGPVTLSFLRWVLALFFLLPFALRPLLRDWQQHRALYWQHRWRILGVSVVGVAAFNTLVYTGLRSTTATNGILLNSFIPILIVLLGVLFYGQKLRWSQALGLLVSFAGVLGIILHGDWSRLWNLAFGQGDLIVFAAVTGWAVYTLWLRGIPPQINRMALLVVQILLCLLVLLPFFLWEMRAGPVPQWNGRSLAALAYISIFPSVLAYLLYNHGVAQVGAARAGAFIHLMPVFGAILSVLLLGETLHLYHALGMACILGGIVLSGRR
ncbi:DMT family transporter [Lampropedia hyalina]|jgi:drug/metabolite transporter (DMT)-like permease|nr:DMT family transporter [Lampropedia hyalina]